MYEINPETRIVQLHYIALSISREQFQSVDTKFYTLCANKMVLVYIIIPLVLGPGFAFNFPGFMSEGALYNYVGSLAIVTVYLA